MKAEGWAIAIDSCIQLFTIRHSREVCISDFLPYSKIVTWRDLKQEHGDNLRCIKVQVVPVEEK